MSHIIAIDLNPLEVEFNPDQVRDAAVLLFGEGDVRAEAEVEEDLKSRLQDAVIDAIGTVIGSWVDVDFIIRVEQPKVPPTPLVKAINTVPF